jgi:UDP-GlcNAc:undecaprenyl-phosphate/decaprenyl-phosphate GlcNAc-1-phosphate transferase
MRIIRSAAAIRGVAVRRLKNGHKQQLADKIAAKPVVRSKRPRMNAFLPAWSAWSALLAATVASMSLIMLRRPGRLPTAHPNVRSLHRRPVPRGGGLAIWIGWLAGTLWLTGPQPWVAPLLLLIAVSFWDDLYGVPALVRLLVQTGAACAWVWLAESPVNALVAVVAIVWMANLFNFMDGSDGLALMMALTGFGAYAVAASLAGADDAPLLWALVAAILPCLALNLPPARLFMGDVGAVPLGFIAAALGISGFDAGAWPAWFPVLVFVPFIADASVTLVLRLARGATVWKAHREHFYQKLVQLGLGHRGTLVLYGALMFGSAASALLALVRAPASGPAVLALWGAAMALLFAVIGYYWRAKEHTV